MTRRTVHIPDDLDERVLAYGSLGDSYSKIVQEALCEYLDRRESEEDPELSPADA